MFDKIKAVIRELFDVNDMQRVINESLAVSSKMRTAINDWAAVYKNEPPWKKSYRRSMNLGKTIPREFARLVLLEAQITVENSEECDKVMKNVLATVRPHFEKALAKGGMAFKPYISRDNTVTVDFVDAENFYPINFSSSGEIYGAVFVTHKIKGAKHYTRLEVHEYDFDGRFERIRNSAYVSGDENAIGRKCSLAEVDEWAMLAEDAKIMNIDKPLFSYFRVPFANTIDDTSPLGVSVFEDAFELLEDADRQYSRYLWEYEGGEMAIDANTDILDTDEENPDKFHAAENSNRIYRKFGGYNSNGSPFYEVFAPQLRDDSYNRGIETILRRIEYNVSLAYGMLSNVQNIDKTAEEVRSSKQRTESAVTDMQKSLQTALENLAYAVHIWLCMTGSGESSKKKLSITFTWDDSIVRDTQREFTERLQLTSAGIASKWEMREWYFGESEEQAKKMCPGDDIVGGDEE